MGLISGSLWFLHNSNRSSIPDVSSNAEGYVGARNHTSVPTSPHPSGSGPRWTTRELLSFLVDRAFAPGRACTLDLSPPPGPGSAPRLHPAVAAGLRAEPVGAEALGLQPLSLGPWEWEQLLTGLLRASACALLFPGRGEGVSTACSGLAAHCPTPRHQLCPPRPASAG
uniref:Uncharacterized protein n=1 Tax=Molossus molossus TaxID=27622 RepID=A0A7J8JXJ0_MOLMO|nr:hypothetical protein HJG59_008034 [Molossus molossus]